MGLIQIDQPVIACSSGTLPNPKICIDHRSTVPLPLTVDLVPGRGRVFISISPNSRHLCSASNTPANVPLKRQGQALNTYYLPTLNAVPHPEAPLLTQTLIQF